MRVFLLLWLAATASVSWWLLKPLPRAKWGNAKDSLLPGFANSPHLRPAPLGIPGVAAGPALDEDPAGVVVLLHGFPDTHWTFSHQMQALAERGFLCVAPAMRGYTPESAARHSDFTIPALARDAVDVIEQLRSAGGRVHLVGHDWGSAVAQAVVRAAPERVETLTLLAVPTASRVREALLAANPLGQLAASWYMLFFQLPLAPEAWLLRFGGVERLWADWGERYSPARVMHVRKAFLEPGVASAVVGYYRQNVLQSLSNPPPHAPVPVPTLAVFGAADGCITPEVFYEALKDEDYPQGLHVVGVERAGHFAHLEQPEAVSRALVDHVSASG